MQVNVSSCPDSVDLESDWKSFPAPSIALLVVAAWQTWYLSAAYTSCVRHFLQLRAWVGCADQAAYITCQGIDPFKQSQEYWLRK